MGSIIVLTHARSAQKFLMFAIAQKMISWNVAWTFFEKFSSLVSGDR